jgi:8-oxo-dGTP pyrophosphatase MutT (NUDIX family)
MSQASNASRPAATVLVVRPRAETPELELFMLRRSSKSTFMPDALVFPGGGVDPEDDLETGDIEAGGPSHAREDRAHLRAACRECVEEASLAIAAERLHWFDTWKTPSGESPRRFVARFYVTMIAAHEGHDAKADGSETRAGRWWTAAEVLAAWEREEVDLPPPTLGILLRMAAGDWQGWIARAPEQVRAPILPKIAAVGSTIEIVMPHDPAYADLPGEGAPAPERAHAFPRRFARRGKRWIPND